MKKKNVFKWWGVVLILSMCSVHAEAQDLKSVLTGVAKAVIGNKATTAHSIVGTWTYQLLNVSSRVISCWQRLVER
mgnify:CR=1 FL=1